MPTYVMLSNLTSEGARALHDQPSRLQEVNAEIEELGCRVISQYATLGSVDFVTVIEAKDNEAIADVSVALSSRGSVRIVTLPAIDVADLLNRVRAHNATSSFRPPRAKLGEAERFDPHIPASTES
jgi:uncharacterized protein with GYD domain